MWYVAELLFAQPKADADGSVICETCDVLFEAPSAVEAYEKALQWAAKYEAEPGALAFVGVENLRDLLDAPADGVEIGGRFFESEGVWERREEIIPARDEISTVKGELHPETKVSELLDDRKRRIWKRLTDE